MERRPPFIVRSARISALLQQRSDRFGITDPR